MSLLTLLLLSLSQQAQTVQRTEKIDYIAAAQKCREGEAQIETDPKAAIEKFDEILNNPKIKRVE